MGTNPTSPEAKTPHYRGSDRDELTLAVRDLDEALCSARRRSQKWLAWHQLNVKDEHSVNRVTPYTLEAIATLEAAYASDESDCDVIHHLAIAYHAMAWDLELCEELRESSAVSEAWEKAFFYWRKLQTCGTFWQDLCAKGETLGEEFDRSIVEEFRHNIIRYLIEIHVEFIQHYYYNLKRPDQASRHIELIRRARIPPAARKELAVLAYKAMESPLQNVVDEGRFGDALTILDGFLSLFPSHLPALQTYLEVTKRWVDQMSPSSQWQEICELDNRVLPRWDVLSTLKHLPKRSLAQAVLGKLASTLGSAHWVRARSLRSQREEAAQKSPTLECEEYKAYERAISWLKRVEFHTPNDPKAQFNLLNALMSRAEFATYVGWNADDPDVAYQLLEEALSDCQEAMKVAPDESVPRKSAAQILQARAEYRLTHIPAGLSDLDFDAHLRSVEEDLTRAIGFDPENPSLQESLNRIREASEA